MSNKTRKIDLIDLINTPWLPKFSFQWDGITAAILNWWDLEMVQPVSTRPLRPLRSIQFPPVLLQSSTAQASALQSQPGESMVSRENRQKPMGLPEFFYMEITWDYRYQFWECSKSQVHLWIKSWVPNSSRCFNTASSSTFQPELGVPSGFAKGTMVPNFEPN